jgi:hypothetical protein
MHIAYMDINAHWQNVKMQSKLKGCKAGGKKRKNGWGCPAMSQMMTVTLMMTVRM